MNLVKNKSYYYDEMVNGGVIIPIEDNDFKKNGWFITCLLLFMVKIKLIIKKKIIYLK